MEKDIKTIVKEKYTEVVTQQSSCCGPSNCCSGPTVDFSDFSESYAEQDGYVADADLNLGCGLPTEFAKIKRGDTVLDLGAGAGNDLFVARSLAGPEGFLIGIDMTEAMVERAKANQAKLGFTNMDFRLGDIEDMPIEDDSVDVAISNCVMNLVPDKALAYAELFRVLKPGGHFSISDVVLKGELPQAIAEAAALYAGCVAGAMQKEDYLAVIREAGFADLEVQKERLLHLPDELLLEYVSQADLEAFRASGASVYSINVFARKAHH